MKMLKNTVILADHVSRHDIDWNDLDHAMVYGRLIHDGGDTYHRVEEIDGGHGLYIESGSGGEDIYLPADADWSLYELPDAAAKWVGKNG